MAVNWPALAEIPGVGRKHKARVRDISLFGLGIELAFQPELNSLLLVHIKSGTGLGRVKHCRNTGHNRYWVGLYLEEFQSEEQNSQHAGYQREGSSQSLGRLLRQLMHSITGARV
jgi:hypothetical protein